jgi:S-DNA-T family DNA segregation ATPase FtsK/SpoIIIE
MTDEQVQAYEPPTGAPRPDVPRDMHLDIALDDEPDPSAVRKPVFVDVVAKSDERRPVVPAALRSRDNFKAAARYHAGRTGHRIAYHAVRAPHIYLPKALFWSLIGAARLAGRAVRWWWHPELSTLLQQAASEGDLHAGPSINAKLAQARRSRALFLLSGLVALLVAGVAGWQLAPRWALWAVVATAVPWLAHIGRPKTSPIVSAAVVTPRFRRLNPDVVLRAYYVAKLGRPDKPDEEVGFEGTMARDPKETGSQVQIVLPYGKTHSDVMNAKDKLASGLDVSVNQVFLTKSRVSERRHELFVADQDPLAIPVGRTDMLDCKPRSIWRPIRIGRDERDRLVTMSLLWKALLVGAQPRKGKTFFVRLVLLWAALDPWVKILGADGKKSTDYDKVRLVAHRWVIGDAPNPRDDDPLQHLEDMLDETLAHIAKANDVLASLPVEMCPEGVLTEALSRDPRYPDLRVWVLVGEEFQVYFETEDQDFNKRIAHKWGRIMSQGPSVGVILLDSTQKPSGVGAGQEMARLFNRFRDNHTLRFALKCGNRDVSIATLGADSYQEGYDASSLPLGDGQNGTNDYRGVGILYGATDKAPTVRTFLADHADAEKILIAARRHRERLGLLSGDAAGETVAREYRDVMADARSVFYAGEARISWPELAHRMREVMPQHYADLTPEAISAQLRSLGVKPKPVRDATHFEGGVGQGFELASLDAAIKRRELESVS